MVMPKKKKPCPNVIKLPGLVQQCGLAIGNGERPLKMIPVFCEECKNNAYLLSNIV